MTGQSAKRLGLEVEGDLELELRLRRIEAALDGKIDANQDATATGRGKGGVPQVTGLRVTGQTPGSVTIAWNPVAIPDLRRYELNFATNLGYSTNLKSAIEATTQYTFNTASTTGGGGGATWYARVRAVNSSGVKGIWSVTLNLTTGQAQTDDLAEGSVTGDVISSSNPVSAGQVSYDNSTSGNAGDNVQNALDNISFHKSYSSGYGALPTQNSNTEYTHGLGVEPKLIVLKLKCTTADGDFSAGDIVYLGGGYSIADLTGFSNDQSSMKPSYISSTVIRVTYKTANQAGLTIPDKDGSAYLAITDGSWNINVDAYA